MKDFLFDHPVSAVKAFLRSPLTARVLWWVVTFVALVALSNMALRMVYVAGLLPSRSTYRVVVDTYSGGVLVDSEVVRHTPSFFFNSAITLYGGRWEFGVLWVVSAVLVWSMPIILRALYEIITERLAEWWATTERPTPLQWLGLRTSRRFDEPPAAVPHDITSPRIVNVTLPSDMVPTVSGSTVNGRRRGWDNVPTLVDVDAPPSDWDGYGPR